MSTYDTIPNWANSTEGRPIPLHMSHHFRNGTPKEKPILFLGGTHGDEPEGVWLAEETLEWLDEVQRHLPENYKIPWLLISCLNPDGFSKNQRVNGRGVDLNRNFPDKSWSPKYEVERYFPGPAPASEPETRALVSLIEKYPPQLIVHCHSWYPCIVLTGERGQNCAEYLSKSTGYKFKHDIGYPCPGSLGEFGWVEKSVPVICVEVEEKVERSKIRPLFYKGVTDLFQFGVK